MSETTYTGSVIGRPSDLTTTHYEGHYAILDVTPDTLTISLADEGRACIGDPNFFGVRDPDHLRLISLLEDHLFEGDWRVIWPNQVGDLRDEAHLVLSREWEVKGEQDGTELLAVGRAYHYPRFALDCYTDVLREEGSLEFVRYDYGTLPAS